MVTVIKIKNLRDLEHGLKTLSRIKKNLPLMTSKGMMRWGKILAKDMKQSAQRAGIKPFTGRSFREGIRWEQRERGRVGKLIMPLYMVYLDSMAPHYISVHRRRVRLLRWAKQARSRELRSKARKVETKKVPRFSVYVRPHPFIRSGWRRARGKLRPVLRRLANRAMRMSA